MMRKSEIKRKTKETDITVSLDIDGTGASEIDTPVGFFNHLLESFSKHGSFDIQLKAGGDLDVDQHHLVEDCGIVLGQAFDKALGDRKGISRAGFFMFPMDEALAIAAVDFSGRGFLQYEATFSHQFCGNMEIGLLEDFLLALANRSRSNIAVRIPHGRSDHHKAEAAFKALARAVRMACEIDPRNRSSIPSTKGVI
jgi:imidazoleglycerol-phosphate dehydratase